MIQEIKLKKSLECEIHHIEKTDYCMNEGCKLALCLDCFIEGHIGHKKRKVAEVYEDNKRALK